MISKLNFSLSTVLVSCALLSACSGEPALNDEPDLNKECEDSSSCPDHDAGVRPDEDGGVDPNQDGGVTSDMGTDQGHDAGCTGEECVKTPDTDLIELLGQVDAETSWASLDEDIKQQVIAHAEAAQAEHLEEWGTQGLERKTEALSGAPSSAMSQAFEGYLQSRFANVLGDQEDAIAALDVDLLVALKKLYVAEHGGKGRLLAIYHGGPETSWDGTGTLKTFPMPEPTAREQLRAYGEQVVGELEALELSGEVDRQTRDRALYYARSIATGSAGYGLGGRDMQTVWGNLFHSSDAAAQYAGFYGEDTVFEGDEAFLRLYNGMMWVEDPLYVSEGSMHLVNEFLFPFFATGLADTAEPVWHAHLLLTNWWLERVSALPQAQMCSTYTAQDRAMFGRAFAAESLIPEVSLDDLASTVEARNDQFIEHYRGVAMQAYDTVFPDEALSTDARAQVAMTIGSTRALGTLRETMIEALDAATGSTQASERFAAALDAQPKVDLDGAEELDPAIAADMQSRWDEVRAFLIADYGGRGVDLDASLPQDLELGTGAAIFTTGGQITFGLGAPDTMARYYKIMLHEAHHAAGEGVTNYPEGIATEGAAIAAENMVGPKFFKKVFPDTWALWEFNSVTGPIRLVAVTDATLQVLTRESCGETSAVELAQQVAAGWGFHDLEEAGVRAQMGTQFLQYLTGEVLYSVDLAAYERALEPGVDNEIDPFDLLVCGVASVAPQQGLTALRECLGE